MQGCQRRVGFCLDKPDDTGCGNTHTLPSREAGRVFRKAAEAGLLSAARYPLICKADGHVPFPHTNGMPRVFPQYTADPHSLRRDIYNSLPLPLSPVRANTLMAFLARAVIPQPVHTACLCHGASLTGVILAGCVRKTCVNDTAFVGLKSRRLH